MRQQQKKVSKNIFIISILLSIIALATGITAVYMEEYIISGAMLFVMVLQIHNIISYKRQNDK